ncbi:hypothetical protein N7G274_001298 [Stereocaulon virgatum]|uniref:ATP synthase F0 subunit 8 n=1 Tax=Stereocaulon virgatum TaxID=373712 RepID=A0ABR4ANE1_9LECA
MAPFSIPLRNTSLPITPFTLTHQIPLHLGYQATWGLTSFDTIIFGVLILFMVSIAIRQGKNRVRQCVLDVEQGGQLVASPEQGKLPLKAWIN